MAGTIPLSMTQQLDQLGKPLAGGKLYIIQAGTVSTPQIAYQDSALTIPVSGGSVITLDATGRIPQFFLADGSVKIRLTNAAGSNQLTADGILVVGASSGGGGGSPVDATTVLATGDIKARYGTGVLSGFVRANGRTIGSSTSSATERANADTQALFEYLWNADANLAVSTGRGANAAADWAANKNIALPNAQGKALAGLDDMGASAGGWFTGATFVSGSATVLGSIIGAVRRTLTAAQIPSITSANASQSITVSAGGSVPTSGGSWFPLVVDGGVTYNTIYNPSGNSNATSFTGSNSISVTSNNTSGQAHDTVSPYLLVTLYIKL